MYSEEDIDDAVKAGVLSATDAASFRSHIAEKRSSPLVDEEHFRLITGFNDVFVTIAALMVIAAVAWLTDGLGAGIGGFGVAITAWPLAEYFTRKRRMALPSILLLLAFVGGCFWGVAFLLIGPESLEQGGLRVATAGATAAGAAWLHWHRFRVPITIAAGAAAIVVAIFFALLAMNAELLPWIPWVSFFAGIAVFTLAMRWDLSDPARKTRRSDVAFWLHLLAAPLIVQPVFSATANLTGMNGTVGGLMVIALYVLVGLVALAVDRRALLVSALAYLLSAISGLFREFGAVSLNVAMTALIIGGALLLLSVFWQDARRFVLPWVTSSLRAKLPAVSS